MGFPKEYVEAYEPRAGFFHPHDEYDTLGPLGEITSIAAQHVTRSRRCAIIDELNSIASNKIEPSISEYRRSDLRKYYYQRSKGNSLLTFTVQRLKDLRRMHRGLHGFP